MNTPWSTIGYLVYKRTYARRIDEADVNSRTEEFDETVDRVVKSSQEQLGVGFTPEEEQRLRTYLTGMS